MERIKQVKTFTNDLTNKMRQKVNLFIDAVNSQKLDVQSNAGLKLRGSGQASSVLTKNNSNNNYDILQDKRLDNIKTATSARQSRP